MFKQFRMMVWVAMTGILIAIPTIIHASQFDAELLKLTNAERKRAGLPALKLSSPLGQAAQKHAENMARKNYFSHTSLNGSSVGDRVKAQGYQYSYVGENIAAGKTTSAKTIQQWMNSSGHRKNILKRDYTEIGFGYAYNEKSKYKHYWVQVFGKSRDSDEDSSSPNPTTTKPLLQTKSDALFKQLEKLYPEYFSPSTSTQSTKDGDDPIYYRLYNNSYESILATYLDGVYYSFYDEWNYFSTLDEANQVLCNDQCW